MAHVADGLVEDREPALFPGALVYALRRAEADVGLPPSLGRAHSLPNQVLCQRLQMEGHLLVELAAKAVLEEQVPHPAHHPL